MSSVCRRAARNVAGATRPRLRLRDCVRTELPRGDRIYQVSQWMSSEAGTRLAGLKSVPRV